MPHRNHLVTCSVAAALAAAVVCAGGVPAGAAAQAPSDPLTKAKVDQAACQAKTGTSCYTAEQLRRAYGVDALAKQGITGKAHHRERRPHRIAQRGEGSADLQ